MPHWGSSVTTLTFGSRSSILSSAERAAVAIARSMQGWGSGAALLALDEPTATLPRTQVDRLFELVRLVRAMGTSVLYVTHHLDEVFAVSDRVTVLRDGRRIVTCDTTDLDHDELVTHMLGEPKAPVVTHRKAPQEPILRTHGVSGSKIRDLDLTVHAGEVVGVAGITGSGREELPYLLFGGRPRKGDVFIDDTLLPKERPDLSVAMGVGLVPSDRHGDGLIMTMSVLENLTLPNLRPYWRKIFAREG